MASGENPAMWQYWRDKKGIEDAITTYFPVTVENDMVLKMAYAQLTVAKLAIGARMKELAPDEWDDDL